jgi:hypothetical protein
MAERCKIEGKFLSFPIHYAWLKYLVIAYILVNLYAVLHVI